MEAHQCLFTLPLRWGEVVVVDQVMDEMMQEEDDKKEVVKDGEDWGGDSRLRDEVVSVMMVVQVEMVMEVIIVMEVVAVMKMVVA